MPAVPSAAASSRAGGRPAALGRYRIVRELGRGAQGCVYLAHDDQLLREVAIKTIVAGCDPARAANLLAEARTTARLQHPHIVALYDAFEDAGLQCLVLEFVPGDTLERILRARGSFTPARAAAVTVQILDGLAYAHERGVVHRDIKPANVLIDAAGNARIMDFGIAAMAGSGAEPGAGTPRYMAPESTASGEVARSTDVFSVGMTLYELLAGQPAVAGGSVFEVLHKIANHPFQAPSTHNSDVSEELDQIVMRALAKNPADRYADAHEMRRALAHYCQPDADDAPARDAADAGGAIEFLMNRMRHKPGFPALSGTISAINRVTASPEQSVQALSEVLLKDFALTNKLLRMVNSTGFGHFGGTISTISRAVLILGFDAVRDLAITLVLFEHLHDKGQAVKLREAVIQTLFTGIVARALARHAGVRDAEEGFVCGVFRNLGRLLAGFYLYDESREVARRIQHVGLTEEAASKAVLGASYSEIGAAVARSWNLPPGIVAAMRPLDEAAPAKPQNAHERLRLVAALAEAVAAAASAESAGERDRQLAAAARCFGGALPVDEKKLAATANESVQRLLDDAAQLLGDSRKSRFCQALRQTAGAAATNVVRATDTFECLLDQSTWVASAGAEAHEAQPAQVLAAGIQDITNSLVDNVNLSDVLRIILETMYRGMGFTRVILFMRDPRAFTLTARFGYGQDLDRIVGRLCLSFAGEHDVFSVSLAKNVDLLISDVEAPNIRARIPEWFRKASLGQTFVLLPIAPERKPIGLLYGEKTLAGELTIEPREMNLMKTLRNQAVLALRQRR
ncbi:MAG: HDOD domain-containing protein [Burkholderiales bacterium]|nr:HDOD domain-containing protein [Burkholderiales bacterium]